MKGLTPKTIADACEGKYFGPEDAINIEIKNVVIDSRQAGDGTLFIPIKGQRVDGHDYIKQVFEKGAACVLSEKELTDVNGKPYVLVKSTKTAIRLLAKYYLDVLGIKVVGITGSVGKTSTKEMVASVLSQRYNTLKTAGNFNNEIGLPLTVFRLTEENEVAVLEMGVDHFGDMDMLAEIARPYIGVFTTIAECHLDNLGDRDGVLRAKTEMFKYMPEGARVVVNADDDKLCTIDSVNGYKTIRVSVNNKEDVFATEIVPRGIEGTDCCIHIGDEIIDVHIAIPGKHMVHNALSAAAVGKLLGLSNQEIKKGIEAADTIAGRCHIVHRRGITIIDDCYNANPKSMRAAIELLSMAETRKIAILGDMFELGSDELELHYNIGKYAVEKGIDYIICIGERSTYMAKGAKDALDFIEKDSKSRLCKVISISDLDAVKDIIENLLKPDDIVLLKASHGMEFNKILDMI